MALTTTEENQLRELLRRMNATQTGKTANALNLAGSSSIDYVLSSNGSSLMRAQPIDLAINMVGTNIGVSGTNMTTASSSANHLMTRDATRSEIARLTDSRITNAQNTANSAVTANAATLQLAQRTESRVRAMESWKDSTVTPGLASRVRVAGGAYTTDPVIFVGPTNPAGTDISSRTHRFPSPMARDPMVFFSLVGDVNYPRYEWLYENGRVVGFILFHSPTPGRWMAIGNLA